jgi:uncharacterized protein (DUF1501 family)
MHKRWTFCDGKGNLERAAVPNVGPERQPPAVLPTRRSLIFSLSLGSLWWAGAASALAQVAVRPRRQEPPGDVLVCIFLRGGADGLSIVPPHGDPDYYRLRPALAVPGPRDRRRPAGERAVDLDGFYGLHPAAAPLKAAYDRGLLAVVHACGSGDQTRSHFEAMRAMERGLYREQAGSATGWLARHLDSQPSANSSPLRAVALGSVVPDSLRGATQAAAMTSLDEFALRIPGKRVPHRDAVLKSTLAGLYSGGRDLVSEGGRETLAVLETLRRIDPRNYRPANGAVYPQGAFGEGLRQVACLLKGGVGLEIACLDHQGPYLWDTHVAQNNLIPAQIADLAGGIAAFLKDIGEASRRTTLLAMTEFGRRAGENTGLGTDHGRASVMLAAGGGVRGGRVLAEWPGLAPGRLEGPGDLRVTTDYRAVLAELLEHRLGNPRISEVLPGYQPRPLGLLRQRAS